MKIVEGEENPSGEGLLLPIHKPTPSSPKTFVRVDGGRGIERRFTFGARPPERRQKKNGFDAKGLLTSRLPTSQSFAGGGPGEGACGCPPLLKKAPSPGLPSPAREPVHEASIVAGMMHILEDEARRHNVSRITRVRLSVGLFTAVEPKTLEACFELYAEGTAAEGAELDITTVPAEGRCLECGHGFPMTSPRCRCPECGSLRLEGKGGRDFLITGIDAC